MKVRLATVDDVPALAQRLQAYYGGDARDIDLSENEARAYTATLVAHPQCAVLVVESDSAIVGAAGLLIAPALGAVGPLTGQELFWCVDKSKAASKALFKALEQCSTEAGCSYITVLATCTRLANMYKSRGYTDMSTTFIKRLDNE